MIRKIRTLEKIVQVEFKLHKRLINGLKPERVEVRGSFRPNWKSGIFMKENCDYWELSIDLPANSKVEFRYVAIDEHQNEHWMNDFQADGNVLNCHGSFNSIIDTDLNRPDIQY